MGTWGPAALDSDDALDLLRHADSTGRRLSSRDPGADILHGPGAPARPELDIRLGRGHRGGHGRSGGLARRSGFRAGITGHDHDVAALVIPGDDPELVGAALAALLIAAGRRALASGLGR